MFSIVQSVGWHENYHCGYCNSNKNFSYGIWAHQLTTEDYEMLINRGWRRSGKYCYKPNLMKMCCPNHTIRCEATHYNMHKSHKKVLKKFFNFLNNKNPIKCNNEADSINKPIIINKPPKKGDGPDLAKPPCLKRKLIVREKYKLKPNCNNQKTLETMINEKYCESNNLTSRFKILLLPAKMENIEFKDSIKSSYKIFNKYQQNIHKDDASELKYESYKRFLMDSPLIAQESHCQKLKDKSKVTRDTVSTKSDETNFVPLITGYGLHHCQYILDGNIIAVGVLDILPHCVSSKYFYYDPQYNFLSLGVLSAIVEIGMVRKFNRLCDPTFQFYYMGYYIHTCPKMRYKAQFEPSSLLCDVHQDWHPFPECLNLFERLNDSHVTDFCHPSTYLENSIDAIKAVKLDKLVDEAFEPNNNIQLLQLDEKFTSCKIAQSESSFNQQLILYNQEIITCPQYLSLLIYLDTSKEQSIFSKFKVSSNDLESNEHVHNPNEPDKDVLKVEKFKDIEDITLRSYLQKVDLDLRTFTSFVEHSDTLLLYRPNKF